MTRRAFTLVELLICIAIIAVLVGLLVAGLTGARDTARSTLCLSNHRQIVIGWTAYANDYRDRAMPLAYWTPGDTQGGEQVFWWGTYGSAAGEIDHDRGFIAPYLGADLARKSVFECPSQPWGSYAPQGGAASPTSTYGYNGYYLSPSRTPGWASTIGHRPWRRLSEIQRPCELFVFADTLLAATPARNCALLDPPRLWDGYEWTFNESPTTAFRHARPRGGLGAAAISRADGSVRPDRARAEWLTDPVLGIGSVGTTNDPHYVPDAAEWR